MRGPVLETGMTGQSAFLAMVVVGMVSLPLSLAWAVFYTRSRDQSVRKAVVARDDGQHMDPRRRRG